MECNFIAWNWLLRLVWRNRRGSGTDEMIRVRWIKQSGEVHVYRKGVDQVKLEGIKFYEKKS